MKGLTAKMPEKPLLENIFQEIRKAVVLSLRQALKSLIGLLWWLSGGKSVCQCRQDGFDLGVGTIP